MWLNKIAFLMIAFVVGATFQAIGIPAGWLLGAIFTGIVYGLFVTSYSFNGWPFQVALILVGANIGVMMEPQLFLHLHQYILPLILTLGITLLGGLLFGILLDRWTSLDRKTAFFCTVPGGASEVIALSSHYGADERIVASFHTARITMFVLLIPFGVGMVYGQGSSETFTTSASGLEVQHVLYFSVILILTMLLTKWLNFAGATLIYAIMIGFVASEFVFTFGALPSYIPGIGQVLIGAMVGIRFERSTLERLREIGIASAKILGLYMIMAICIAFIFYLFTPMSYLMSLLSTVPAGAPEMSSTALSLKMDPSLVASLHIIRMIVVLLVLPHFLKWMLKKS
ncbi:AbrB family transcriptional regulator [Geomicrobium sediminis]|uniref:Membrane AbrB-like protein n=1 Tax=Geomicrobium sediminis TaxID=1347788 RepID=A0ABS2PGC4_9BACL|nr:AbrB family transcriptional regulator [Geomicrobium sediminis]MBM7634485.1 membrane AbrB-like protein [Geomicrobium sediminis]